MTYATTVKAGSAPVVVPNLIDFLTFVSALHERLGVDIPERDYPQLGTLDAVVEYVARSSPQQDQRPR